MGHIDPPYAGLALSVHDLQGGGRHSPLAPTIHNVPNIATIEHAPPTSPSFAKETMQDKYNPGSESLLRLGSLTKKCYY